MGIATQVIGADRAARATQRAATDASNMAREQQRQARMVGDSINTDLTNLARATPQELRAYEGALKASENQLAQDERLLQAIDPSIMEASNQILSLLKGERTNSAFTQSREAERTRLLNTLRSQMGPGAEQSAAGQRMLREFDLGTAGNEEQMRQGQIGSLMNLINARPDNQKALAGLFGAAQGFGGIQERRIGARQAGGQAQLSALMGTAENVIGTSGAGAVGNQLIGRSREQMGRSIFSGVMGILGNSQGASNIGSKSS